jgi:hypothetical protein
VREAYLTEDHQNGLHQECELKVLSEPEEAPGDIGHQPGNGVRQTALGECDVRTELHRYPEKNQLSL